MRPRLSYANVASTLALVLALGGVSYAAVKINGANLKPRSVPASKIKKNTLTGTEVKESKLGKVPKATAADSAANAGNANTVGGQTSESLKVACPQGTTFKLGECFETSLKTAATFPAAVAVCSSAGRRVPTIDELDSLRVIGVAVGVPPNNYEMSSTPISLNQVTGTDPMGNRFTIGHLDPRPYRCVGLPTNTGP